MKKTQIYSSLLLVWLLLLTLATFTPAATPSYCGVENNDSFTFNTTYDEGPLKDRREDMGEEADMSEDAIDDWVDELDTNEDLTELKIVILDVDDEEKSPWGDDGVRIIYNVHIKEGDDEWDLESEDETFAVWDYDKDVYDLSFFVLDWEFEFDTDDLEWEDYKYLRTENPWFISTKVDWGEVEEEIEEYLEDDLDYDDVSVKADKDANSLEINMDNDEDDDIEAVTYFIEYDNNGVLMYYEWQYDGDPIIIVERQGKFFIDNMLWIIIGAIGIVVVVIVIIVLVKRR